MLNEFIQQITQFVHEQVQQNELFKGGLILGIGAALLSYARAWPATIWGWFIYHFTVELDIPEGTEAFRWVDRWLSKHKYSVKHARRLTATSSKKGGILVPRISPAPGRHYMFEGGRLVIVNRTRETLEAANSGKAYTESISIRVIGRSRAPALKILDKAFSLAEKPKSVVPVHYCDDYGTWFQLTEKAPRPIKSIVLDAGMKEEIVEDARQFLSRQQFYTSLGVPWRRGYLFYGPPGNGKTSMIFGLASELKMDISYLNLKEVTDTTLMRGLSDIPSNSLLVIEDIDCLFSPDDTRETKASISFAALINALDGVASSEGQIIIMTTNKRERLDQALIRPGRVDKEVEFENATTAQACELFQLFYPGTDVADFRKAYGALTQRMSMAALQGHFLTHDCDTAINL